jgi:hypothetical protein
VPGLKSNYKRKGPSATQEAYIEKVASPRNLEDLILSLQDPASPAYKKMMNMLNDEIQILIIIEILIEKFVLQKYEASKKEKDDIFKELLAKELVAQEKSKQLYADQLKEKISSASPVTDHSAESLKQRLDERAVLIHLLRQRSFGLKEELVQLSQQAAENTTNWERINQEQASSYLQELIEQQIYLITAKGERIDPNSAQAKAIIEQIYAATPPAKLLDILLNASEFKLMEAPSRSESASVSTASAAAERYYSDIDLQPAQMMQKACIGRELKLINALAEDQSNTNVVNAMNNNRDARLHLPGAEGPRHFARAQTTYAAVVKRQDALGRYVKSELEQVQSKNLNVEDIPGVAEAQTKASVIKDIEALSSGGVLMGSDLLRAMKQKKLEPRAAEPIQPIQVSAPLRSENKVSASHVQNETVQLYAEAIHIKKNEFRAKNELAKVETQLNEKQSQQALEAKLYSKEAGVEYKENVQEVKQSQGTSFRRGGKGKS